ncbi:unnamed protein product [Cladocopium goreaui]|uniref:Polycystin-2 n=1 Tax=Cladocopium goreaui TaxID=2562237 RepID=A0A9P1GQ31_9DINO|nr:unnamed protein product [Cladocopium goreaui]
MKLNPMIHPITRITDVNTLYDYLEEVFIPAIYKNSTDIQLAESISPHLRPIDIANRLLGTVRLRQVRVDLTENCQVLPLFEQYTVSCYPNYSPGTASKVAFGPQQRFTHSADGSGIGYEGLLGAYGPDGFMQLLASNGTLASQQIQQLRIDGFLDAATRAFFAEFNIWNSNVGLYAVVNFAVEFGASGGTAQEIEITTMTERVLTVGGLGTGMDWFAFVLLILVMVFVVQFIIEEVGELYQSWRTYFFDAWNLLDWANMVLLLVGFTMRMLLFSDAANANVGIEQLTNKESFQNISALASAATTVRVLNAFNCVLLWGKVTKYLRHLPLVKGLIRTVWDAFDLFLPFLIMFCVGMVGFVMAFNVGFGDKVSELRNFSESAVYLCRAFLKDVQLMPVYDITPLFGAGLILLFYLNMIAAWNLYHTSSWACGPFAIFSRASVWTWTVFMSLEHLAPDVLVEILSYITHNSQGLSSFGALCQKVNGTLNEESAWQHLCQKYWHSSDARLKDWPMLSARGLYRALEQWMPMEGFYVLTTAFPWGLLALLRIESGKLCARVVRFLPDTENFSEIEVPLFEVSIREEKGNIRSSISAPWLQPNVAATVAPIESSQLLASTEECFFHEPQDWRGGPFPSPPCLSTGGNLGYPYGLQDYIDSDSDQDEVVFLSEKWSPGRLGETEGEVKQHTSAMLRDMLGSSRSIPCDLALIRSPDEFMPADPSVPRLRPGLYVGDYAHALYGQFRVEVLLLDYVSLTPDEIRAELQDPRRLFGRPGGGHPPPAQLQALAEMNQTITFMRVVKQCGDLHVPMGATTFVAVCADVSSVLTQTPKPSRVQNRQTWSWESVARSWRGFGTLATPGFARPSWATGWLVQFAHGTGDRFGFVWDRNQDAVVLKWPLGRSLTAS